MQMLSNRVLSLILVVFTVFSLVSGHNPVQAQTLTHLTVRLNAVPYGSHAGFFVAKKEGYYQQAGLDVDILVGKGSQNVVALVGRKTDDFGYASSASIVSQVANNVPIIAVATIDATDADAVICNPAAGVKVPKDLEGKTIVTSAGASVNVLFPAFLKAAKVDDTKVNLINVTDATVVTDVVNQTNGASCLLGGLDDKPAQIKQEGNFDPTYIKYNEYIPPTVGYGLVTNLDNLKQRPEVVKAFIEATLKGYAFAKANPGLAIDDLVFYNKDLDPKQLLPQLTFTLSILTSRNNKTQQIGLGVQEDWQATLNVQKTYNSLVTDKTVDAFYTNDFLPTNLTIPTAEATMSATQTP